MTSQDFLDQLLEQVKQDALNKADRTLAEFTFTSGSILGTNSKGEVVPHQPSFSEQQIEEIKAYSVARAFKDLHENLRSLPQKGRFL